MEVPFEDYDVNTLIDAIERVRDELVTKEYSTYSELDSAIAGILASYDRYGDGFERFRVDLTRDAANTKDLRKIKEQMSERCERRIFELRLTEKQLVNDMLAFVSDNSRILVHGSGSLLALAIACAIELREGVQFYICEGRTHCGGGPREGSGYQLLEKVPQTAEGTRLGDKLNKYCTVIPDSGVGAVLGLVDFVVMGALCVTEHGGLVNTTGSFQIATVASSRNTPVYVLCDTFKFARVFPLGTEDLRQPDKTSIVPLVEFVPPHLITLIFSEKGIMPSSAVADIMFRFHTAGTAPWKRK